MFDTIVVIGDGTQETELVSLVQQHQNILYRYRLLALENTAQIIQQYTNLQVEPVLSSLAGGYVQIAAKITQGEVIAVICLLPILSIQEQIPDLKTVLRLCDIYNIPLALNVATAEAIVASLTKFRIAHLIFNPVSGQGNSAQDLLLIRKLLEPYLKLQVTFTEKDIPTQHLTSQAIATVPDLVIASGGDGTISSVATALVNTDVPLAVIPRGTANAFASALGIPHNIRGACNAIISGKTRRVDTALCNDTTMVLLAGIGYEAEMVAKAPREAKKRWGALAYIMAAIQQFTIQQLFEAELEVDGVKSKFQAGAITLANAAPIGSLLAQGFGKVKSNDGLIEAMVYVPSSKIQAIQAFTHLLEAGLFRKATNREDIICAKAQKIKVKTNPPQKVVVDGEMIGTTPVEVECIPNALKIVVPRIVHQSGL